MVRVLIVGYGFMGRTHAQVYEGMEGVSIVGVVDAYLKGECVALPSGQTIQVFLDLDQAIQFLDPTFVDLCVPTDLHLPLGLKVFQARKPLFCEKPISLDYQGAIQLEQARRKAGVQAMVGHCIRFWPEYRFLASIIRDRSWGALRLLTMSRYASRPLSTSQNWVADPNRCCGAALDLHIHDTDFILSTLGDPQQVSSRGLHESSGWNWIATEYQYQGIIVRAEGGWNLPPEWPFVMSYRALFEGGVIDFNSSRSNPLELFAEQGYPVKSSINGNQNVEIEARANLSGLSGYVETLRYFVEKIRTGEAVEEATLLQAAESLQMTLAEIQSAQNGAPVLSNTFKKYKGN